MKKYILNKKVKIMNDDEAILSFRNKQRFLDFYKKLEATCTTINFRGEPANWACFCKDKNYDYKANVENLTILITKV